MTPLWQKWSEKKTQALIDGIKAGKSLSVLRKELKIGRNEISGKLNRLRAKGVVSKTDKCDKPQVRKKSPAAKKIRIDRLPVENLSEIVNHLQFTSGIDILQIKDGLCKYPLTHGTKKHLFCGCPVSKKGSSWCEEHAKILVVSPREYGRRNAKSVKDYKPSALLYAKV